MFDDIKNIIPKMEKSDSKIVYSNLINRAELKKKNVFAKKMIIVIVSFVILVAISIPIGTNLFDRGGNESPKLDGEDSVIGNLTNENSSNVLFDEASLIGIAAYNEFEEKEALELLSVSLSYNLKVNGDTTVLNDESEEYINISYPYDYVKIIKAYKFSIDVIDISDVIAKSIIENNCGLGELEVVVADFETYIDEDGMKVLSVQDTLISLRGYNGYYTILANSGVSNNKNWLHVFSSHKKLLEDEVNKDFTPPILSIFLEERNDERYVYFETSDNLLNLGNYNKELAFKNINEVVNVSRNTLYSVLELTKLPAKEVEAVVLEIDVEEQILTVKTEYKLEHIHFTKYTEGIKIDALKLGDIIVVEYDYLFDTYDPSSVFANSIEIKSVLE